MAVVAVESREINFGVSERDGLDSTVAPTRRTFGARSRIASILGFRWHPSAGAAEPLAARQVEIPAAPVAVELEHSSMRTSMHEVLTAWRAAERAVREFDEGSPEWAAVNATLISLRATYLARFDEYVSDSPRPFVGGFEDDWLG